MEFLGPEEPVGEQQDYNCLELPQERRSFRGQYKAPMARGELRQKLKPMAAHAVDLKLGH